MPLSDTPWGKCLHRNTPSANSFNRFAKMRKHLWKAGNDAWLSPVQLLVWRTIDGLYAALVDVIVASDTMLMTFRYAMARIPRVLQFEDMACILCDYFQAMQVEGFPRAPITIEAKTWDFVGGFITSFHWVFYAHDEQLNVYRYLSPELQLRSFVSMQENRYFWKDYTHSAFHCWSQESVPMLFLSISFWNILRISND